MHTIPRTFVLASTVLAAVCLVSGQDVSAQEIVDDWEYTLRKPADGWRLPEFASSGWKTGAGGFGVRDTPEAPGTRRPCGPHMPSWLELFRTK